MYTLPPHLTSNHRIFRTTLLVTAAQKVTSFELRVVVRKYLPGFLLTRAIPESIISRFSTINKPQRECSHSPVTFRSWASQASIRSLNLVKLTPLFWINYLSWEFSSRILAFVLYTAPFLGRSLQASLPLRLDYLHFLEFFSQHLIDRL
jgi:hypothetical protein